MYPADINNLGQIAGSTQPAGSYTRAAVWDGERIIDLGTLGGQYSYALALNDLMHVVGASERAPGGDRIFYGFYWRDGQMIDLQGWGGTALNNCGDFLETYLVDIGFIRVKDLIDPNLRWYQLNPEKLNDYGQIVGRGIKFDTGQWRAFLMTPIRGDMNRDGDVDLRDFARLQNAFTGSLEPAIPGCERADIDRDGDVDWADMAMLGARLSGPGVAPPIP